MSGLSPARRIRDRTSDLTDFFRGHSTHHPRQVQSDTENHVSTSTLEVPRAGETSGSGLTKKKTTRIPFLGRTRKKSNQSTTSGPFSSGTDRESSDFPERLSRAASSDHPSAYYSSESPPSRPPLPIRVPSIKTPSPSLGSKFAAHFSAARSRKPPSLPAGRSSPTPSAHGTLSPPLPSPRGSSFDSGSSGATRNGSSTPRPAPAQPTITVSFSPDNVEEYRDLFTLPQNRTAHRAPPQPLSPTRHAGTRRRDGDSDSTPRSTPPLDQPMRSATSDDPTPTGTALHTPHRKQDSPRSSNEDKPPASPSIRPPRQQSGSASKRVDSALDAEQSSKTVLSRREGSTRFPVKSPSATPAQLYATSTRTPAPSTDAPSPTATKSRIRTPSTASDRRSSTRPPSMPLPLPPPPTSGSGSPRSVAPDIPTPSTPSSPLPDILTNSKPLLRPRANTIGTVSNAPVTSSPGVSPASPNSALEATPRPTPEHPIKPPPDFDVNTATREELKTALISRNQQYDELASYLLKLAESHVAETLALEKKISTMEREAARKDKEIKGLTWLVVNNRGPPVGPAATGGNAAASSRPPSTVDSDRGSASSPSFVSSRMSSIRRFQNIDDSGAESYPTSGGESIRGSGTSGTESVASSTRDKRFKRPFTLGESSYNLYRASTTVRRPTDASKVSSLRSDHTVSTASYSTASTNRSSVSSLSPSPSSSSSSLLPPSPTIASSSLSAIPESASPTTQPSKESDDQSHRSAKRLSQTSIASSYNAPNSYGANIKRSRPTSIAQVLEKTQKNSSVEDVLEKLHPFGKLPPSPSP